MGKQALYLFWSLTDGVSNKASIPIYTASTRAPSVWNSIYIISAVDTVVESDLTLFTGTVTAFARMDDIKSRSIKSEV